MSRERAAEARRGRCPVRRGLASPAAPGLCPAGASGSRDRWGAAARPWPRGTAKSDRAYPMPAPPPSALPRGDADGAQRSRGSSSSSISTEPDPGGRSRRPSFTGELVGTQRAGAGCCSPADAGLGASPPQEPSGRGVAAARPESAAAARRCGKGRAGERMGGDGAPTAGTAGVARCAERCGCGADRVPLPRSARCLHGADPRRGCPLRLPQPVSPHHSAGYALWVFVWVLVGVFLWVVVCLFGVFLRGVWDTFMISGVR